MAGTIVIRPWDVVLELEPAVLEVAVRRVDTDAILGVELHRGVTLGNNSIGLKNGQRVLRAS